MYGHYLQKKKQGMSVQCVSVTVLTRNHPLFVEELEKRWAMLESKRTIRLESEHVQNKRQRALSMASDGQHSFSMFDDDSNMSDCPPTSDGKSSSSETPYHFLSAAEKVPKSEFHIYGSSFARSRLSSVRSMRRMLIASSTSAKVS